MSCDKENAFMQLPARSGAAGALEFQSRKAIIKASLGRSSVCCASPTKCFINEDDLKLLQRAAEYSQLSCGETQPHPNAACLLVDSSGSLIAETYLVAQGTESPESQAARAANGGAKGGTAYINLETGDCPGDSTGIQALVSAGVSRIVVGMRHPLSSQRGVAVAAWRSHGITVEILGESQCKASAESFEATMDAVTLANEALLHRAVLRRPMGILKYAMTMDGKIAASSGHSAWVSSPESRKIVFDTRARCDAVIVGGQTVRRDNPRLTTRREGGHQPIRIVMSRTLDLPDDAALWDVSHAPTIVATQRGARQAFQQMLRSRNVEVVEFDFLTPDALAEYCYIRGFLSLLWECGGTLAAPAIAGGAIHKTMAFLAPKLIGGSRAPTPVGDLGFVEMTQALEISNTTWKQVGPDLVFSGYLPSSRGPRALAEIAQQRSIAPTHRQYINGADRKIESLVSGKERSRLKNHIGISVKDEVRNSNRVGPKPVVQFYKAWDTYGALSNFTAHSICMPGGVMDRERMLEFNPLKSELDSNGNGKYEISNIPDGWEEWSSVEHYYQSQKFAGVDHPDAHAARKQIAAASCPEEAATIGRRLQRTRPELVRHDWNEQKISVMHAAVRAKFFSHEGPRNVLLNTAGIISHESGKLESTSEKMDSISMSSSALQMPVVRSKKLLDNIDGEGKALLTAAHIVENSPHDYFWGKGIDGNGENILGQLLEAVREELLETISLRNQR